MALRLSQKHGVNPSVEKCFLCGEAKRVVLFGRLREDKEAPREVVITQEPCDKCKDYMKQGVILISTKDDDRDYRTGGWVVLRDSAIERIFEEEKAKQLLTSRVAFIADSLWDAIELPRGEIKEAKP